MSLTLELKGYMWPSFAQKTIYNLEQPSNYVLRIAIDKTVEKTIFCGLKQFALNAQH